MTITNHLKRSLLPLIALVGLSTGCDYYSPSESYIQMPLAKAERTADKILGEFCKYYSHRGGEISCITDNCYSLIYKRYEEKGNCKDKSLDYFCVGEKSTTLLCDEIKDESHNFSLKEAGEIEADFFGNKMGKVYVKGGGGKYLATLVIKDHAKLRCWPTPSMP